MMIQTNIILHVTWRVAARPERRDSYHRSQHSASVGLAHSTCLLYTSDAADE